MNDSRILIAGVGNIFLGDDAFGVEVARRLCGRQLPGGVRVADFGIRGLDLAYAILYGEQEVTILVDAAPRGGTPGTVYLIEPDAEDDGSGSGEAGVLDPHGMDPMNALRVVKSMGGEPKPIFVVGCEPLTLGPEEGAMGLSAPVELAVSEAVDLIESLLERVLSGGSALTSLPTIVQGGENHGTA